MKPQTAQKIVDALDAELARRRKKRLSALLAQWRAESDDDSVHVVCRLAEWQPENPSPPLPEPVDLVARREREEAEAELDAIVAVHGRLLWKRQAEESGTLHRPQLAILMPPKPREFTSKARPEVIDVLKSGGDRGYKPKARSRTAVWQEQQQAEMAAKLTALPAANPASAAAQLPAIAMHGQVLRYNARSMAGEVQVSMSVMLG
jgi:hypothetical protein